MYLRKYMHACMHVYWRRSCGDDVGDRVGVGDVGLGMAMDEGLAVDFRMESGSGLMLEMGLGMGLGMRQGVRRIGLGMGMGMELGMWLGQGVQK